MLFAIYGFFLKIYQNMGQKLGSNNVVLCLPLHIHDGVENVLKHVLFNVHDVKVMAKKIGLPIRNLPKDTSLYPIMGQTKTRELLLT
jgi:hypothetical protein